MCARVMKELGCKDGGVDGKATPDMPGSQGRIGGVFCGVEYRKLLRKHRKYRKLHPVKICLKPNY